MAFRRIRITVFILGEKIFILGLTFRASSQSSSLLEKALGDVPMFKT